ncbi:MAG: STAS-like domain-containing protein, partial [Verrucomicrobiota bacterium]|nr:STAS-like domain-containing protein [Verrucomicrobiota bacterium]
QQTHFHAPLTVGASPVQHTFLDRVWAFSDFEQVGQLVNGLVNDLEARTQFKDGVLGGIEWCLNEVMDNVLRHSAPARPPLGYVIAQVHRSRVAICVSDVGQGLLNSLATFARKPKDDGEAIRLSVREGVTRDAAAGQGNGLWGLHNIVRDNGGLLTITSGSCSVTWTPDDCQAYGPHLFADRANRGTTVDFQINAQRRISWKNVLNGHVPLRRNLDIREDEYDCQRFLIKDQPGRTSTRLAGQHLFNRILNTCVDTSQRVTLDFSDVQMVASSYADEVVGKLAVKLGFTDFNQRILLRNMNETVEVIINQAVEKRIAEALRARGGTI